MEIVPNIIYTTFIMDIQSELKNLEKVQLRLVRFCNYLEKRSTGSYDDLYIKLSQVVGTIEDVLTFDEDHV